MNKITILENKILEYAWGSRTFISSLIGKDAPSSHPQAEMWMGAHMKAPSTVNIERKKIPLNELIKEYPVEILGKMTAEKFSNELPFLFKVLAASKPLSIQTHPDKKQAVEGFNREETSKIPVDSPERNYRDKNHKPELICAITNMCLLKGFRHPIQIKEYFSPFEKILDKEGIDIIKELAAGGNLENFYKKFISLNQVTSNGLLEEILNISEENAGSDPAYKWVGRLGQEYPHDMSVLAPLILNLINLKPGESLFLPARELHSYLDGAGLEIMANSDNVLRGGLTKKHIDNGELLRVLDFTPSDVNKIKQKKLNDFEYAYDSPAEEFLLSVIKLTDNKKIYKSPESRSVEIMICMNGRAELSEPPDNKLIINKGMCALIPASASEYTIKGKSTLYKAAVPEL